MISFFWPYRNTLTEIECDHFAAKVIGRIKVISDLETLMGIYPTNAPNYWSTIEEINMRIMAFYVPALFRQYA